MGMNNENNLGEEFSIFIFSISSNVRIFGSL